MKLYLDDERPTPDGWVRVYTANGAIDELRSPDRYTHVSLDHDLGDLYTTGYTVACWIEEYAHENPDWPVPIITCHSANPVGRKRIEQVIERLNVR